jgi:hypothetical protein
MIGATADLGISAGQYATTSSTFGLPPPSPQTVGGPLSPIGANSLTNRSNVDLFPERTTTRSSTSGKSGEPAPQRTISDVFRMDLVKSQPDFIEHSYQDHIR